MARNDEGEFELVLGNRQLLSGFFIVVILFGIFFTMGYIVGRNSLPAPTNTAAAASPEPAPVRPAAPAVAPPPGEATVVPVDARKAENPPAEAAEPPATATRPATAPPERPRPIETSAPQPRAINSEVTEPAPGSYLQVAAPKRTAAGGVIDSLKNKGITGLLAPGPNEDTVRVLVGPLDSSSIGKVRVDLESAGFKPFLKKY